MPCAPLHTLQIKGISLMNGFRYLSRCSHVLTTLCAGVKENDRFYLPRGLNLSHCLSLYSKS